MTEAEFTREVLQLCADRKLLAHHCGDSRRCSGSGLPDVIIIGRYHILYAELKMPGGSMSPMQIHWKYSIRAAGGSFHIWTPADKPAIIALLDRA